MKTDLSEPGQIVGRRVNFVLICLRNEPVREAAEWFYECESVWNERLDLFEGYFADKKKKEER